MFTISTKVMRSYISTTSNTNPLLLSLHHIPTKSLTNSPYNIYNHKPFPSNYRSLFTTTIHTSFVSHPSYLHARDFSVRSTTQDQGSSSSSGKPSKSWKTLIAGLLISIFTLPFWKNKLNPFLQLKNEIEMIVEEAEIVAEVVEKVAEEVVEIADALDKKLPEGGKLKDAVELVENAAKELVKDANIAEDVLHKVEEIEKEVDSIIEPVISQVSVGVAKQPNADHISQV